MPYLNACKFCLPLSVTLSKVTIGSRTPNKNVATLTFSSSKKFMRSTTIEFIHKLFNGARIMGIHQGE